MITEVESRETVCPRDYRGDFERRFDDLAGLCRLYEQAAVALGKPGIVEAAHAAAGVLRYGVAPELVPLMALQLPQLAAHELAIYMRRACGACGISSTPIPARSPIRAARRPRRPRRIDRRSRGGGRGVGELVARFRIGPAALA